MALTTWNNLQILNQLNSGWSWSGDTITYAFPTTTSGIYGSDELDGFAPLTNAQQDAATLALQTWDDLIAPDFEYTTSADSNIEFGSSTTGVSYAHAYYPEDGSVWFNTQYTELATPLNDSYGFMTYVHEIGHALGLDHMGNYNGEGTFTPSCYQDSSVYSVMSYFGPDHWDGYGDVAWADWTGADGEVHSPQTPMLNDVMAIQAIYGIESTTRVDDTIYGFNSNIGGDLASIYDFATNLFPILTIFDSAGVDTLNLSGWTTDSIIHLEPGSYSSCNAMTNNIAIAYTCTIENAVGGSGDDTFYGNEADNYLDGGSGDDTVVLSGTLSSYDISVDNLNVSISGVDIGTDYLSNIEWYAFDDGTYALSQLLDDFPAATNTTGSLTAGGEAASGSVGPSGDVDWFKIELQAGSSYTFSLTVEEGNLFPRLQLLSATGQLITQNETYSPENHNALIQYTVTQSGTYYLAASDAYGIAGGDYTIEADYRTGISLTGTAASETLNGTDGNDSLFGLDGIDKLNGNGNNDYLDGGLGADKMKGGNGNDTYIVDNASDKASESSTGGTSDAVYTSVDYTLGKHVEALFLTGTSALNGTGGSTDNALYGNIASNVLHGMSGNDLLDGGDGDDWLNGGKGNDLLHGGDGADHFRFDTKPKALTNQDTIDDFLSGVDVIELENATFKKLLATGQLSAGNFVANASGTAMDADDYLIYNTTTGSLYYDTNGNGTGKAVEILSLSGTPEISASDFLIT